MPPIGSDGKPIQLHHLVQIEPGSLAEILEMTHREYTSQLHGLVGKGRASETILFCSNNSRIFDLPIGNGEQINIRREIA
jgi:hypothetical protein